MNWSGISELLRYLEKCLFFVVYRFNRKWEVMKRMFKFRIILYNYFMDWKGHRPKHICEKKYFSLVFLTTFKEFLQTMDHDHLNISLLLDEMNIIQPKQWTQKSNDTLTQLERISQYSNEMVTSKNFSNIHEIVRNYQSCFN